MIRAGELREKLLFQKPTRKKNTSGGSTTEYTTYLNTFSAVEEIRSNPNLIANQEDIHNYFRFKIRYRPKLFINEGDRIIWRGFNFIVNNIKVSEIRSQIDIYAYEEIKTSQRGETSQFNTFDETFDNTFN